MHRATPNKLFSVLLGTAAVLLMSGSALAVTVQRTQVQYGAGACQGNLPVSATQLRARPLAIKNEGTSSAFVSCSLAADDFFGALNDFNGVAITNSTGAAVEISCTLVTGNIDFPINFFPKTGTIAANSLGVVSWSPAADNGDVPFNNSLNYSCLIPPGVEINGVFTNIEEEVGA
jgi:hypothetical protein